MTFLVQFTRVRRGVPEVLRTLALASEDAADALARAKSLGGTRFWPTRTEAVRVLDDGGRTLIVWTVPVPAAQSYPSLKLASPPRASDEPRPAPEPEKQHEKGSGGLTIRHHHFDVGQPISYAEEDRPDTWKGGYEIMRLADPDIREPQYAIRNPDQAHNRIVQEHELREDLGARVRGR